MKYIAVFDVPDDWEPDEYNKGATASFKIPGEYYKMVRTSIKPMPSRIPKEWSTKEAAGFNACLDSLESG